MVSVGSAREQPRWTGSHRSNSQHSRPLRFEFLPSQARLSVPRCSVPHCRRRRCDRETIRSAAVTPDGWNGFGFELAEGSRFVPKSISSLAHIAVRAEISLAARPSPLSDLARSVLRLAERRATQHGFAQRRT